MKNLLFVAVILCATGGIFGQKEIKVTESNENIAEGSNNALSVIIFEADDKEVEKAWKKLMKDYNAKVSMKKEIFADDATIKDISSNTIDIYAKIEKTKDGDAKITVAFDLGGAFLSSSQHSSQFKAAKEIMQKFGVDCAKEAIRIQVKEAEKVLEKMEGEKQDLVKENENLNNKIAGWEKDIEKAKEDIKTNEKNQEDKTKEIEGQKSTIETIKEKEKQIK
ncbi:MAG: hypothetical protein ABIJ16_10595 [Bacteroidota bacterium]